MLPNSLSWRKGKIIPQYTNISVFWDVMPCSLVETPSVSRNLLSPLSSTLVVQTVGSFETPLCFCQITRRQKTEGAQSSVTAGRDISQIHIPCITNKTIHFQRQKFFDSKQTYLLSEGRKRQNQYQISAVAQLVEALRYKPERRGFIPDGVIGIFPWHNRFGRTMALGSTQPLTEMNTRNISCGVKAAGA
jgi:hypothetical protein